MAIETVFLQLTAAFAALRDALQSLGLTVIEDQPQQDDILLVERLGNLVEDLRGWTEEASAAAVEAQEAGNHPPDWHRARRALGQANEHYLRMVHRFSGEAIAYDMIDPLLRFGRQRGREWLGWTKSVVLGLDACRGPLRTLDEAFLQAWQELAERLSVRSVSLQTTNIGQQISSPALHRTGVQAETLRKDEFS